MTEQELREALDMVWGYLPVKEVKELKEDFPELYQRCIDNHTFVCHNE